MKINLALVLFIKVRGDVPWESYMKVPWGAVRWIILISYEYD
jgi:hypothetical protein